MVESLSLPHPCPTSLQTQQNPTSTRAPHYHTSPLLHETVNLQLFIFPFAVFNTFTPQHLVVVPQREHCVSLLHTSPRALHLCFSLHTIGVSHLPTSSHASSCSYTWFTPILDLYRSHRAMHGNTPGRPSKSDPPPLVPPPPPSPPLTKRKKHTKLDYTDDISIGNPSVSTRRSSRGTTSQDSSSSKIQPGKSTTLTKPRTDNAATSSTSTSPHPSRPNNIPSGPISSDNSHPIFSSPTSTSKL